MSPSDRSTTGCGIANPGPEQKRGGSAIGAVLERTVTGWLEQRHVCRTRLLIGVSGGPDSVALLRVLASCRDLLSLDVYVGHLDHGWRADSASDAAWVVGLSRTLGLPAVTERTNVVRLAEEAGRGIEETARRTRYEFLRQMAIELGCSHVAVAHTADDQTETILHHILRGTGLAGLRGMPEVRPLAPRVTLIRPLLSVSRDALVSYLGELDQDYRTDATNDDERFTRSRLRHVLLPLIREQFNPQVGEALLRLGRQVRDVQEVIENLARRLLERALIVRGPDRVVLDTTVVRAVDRHLLREAMRLLWADQHWPRQRMGFEEWDALAALAQSEDSAKSLTLPHGLRGQRSNRTVEIGRAVVS